MTEYRTIHVDKRSFTVLVDLPELSTITHRMALADDTRITRGGDTRITRDGDTRVVRVTTDGYPRIVRAKKRNFTVLVDKLNGS